MTEKDKKELGDKIKLSGNVELDYDGQHTLQQYKRHEISLSNSKAIEASNYEVTSLEDAINVLSELFTDMSKEDIQQNLERNPFTNESTLYLHYFGNQK